MFKKALIPIKTDAPELGLPALYSDEDCVYVVAAKNERGEFVSLGASYYFKNLEQYEKELEKYDGAHNKNEPFHWTCPEEKCLADILCSHDNYVDTLNDCHLGPYCETDIYGLEPETGSDAIVTVDDRTVVILKINKINITITRDYYGEYDSEIDYDYMGISLDTIRADVTNGKLPKSVLEDIEEILSSEFEDPENVFALPELPDETTDECTIPDTLNLNAKDMETEYQKTHDWTAVYTAMNMD